MKRKYLIPAVIGGAAILTSFSSCLDDDNDIAKKQYPTAVVTVIPYMDEGFVMQLDDKTRLIPTNIKKSPFGDKQVRALVNFTETETEWEPNPHFRYAEVNWIDSIRTKHPVASVGADNDLKFGHDPIEIIDDWVTVAEDGFLTLRIRTVWGGPYIKHNINLLTGTNPDDPYEFELRHDAFGDVNGEWGDALIAFNLNDMSGYDGQMVKIRLKWRSFYGDKTAEFDLKMRDNGLGIYPGAVPFSRSVE